MAPYLIGVIKEYTGSLHTALAALAILSLASMIVLLALRRRLRPATS